jgi:hypothetical protein
MTVPAGHGGVASAVVGDSRLADSLGVRCLIFLSWRFARLLIWMLRQPGRRLRARPGQRNLARGA